MGQQVNVNFKLDSDIKQRMQEVCEQLGLSMSTAFTIFATKVSRESRIPFEVSADPFYSQENMERLEKNRLEMETTGGTIHEVDSYAKILD